MYGSREKIFYHDTILNMIKEVFLIEEGEGYFERA